MVQKEEAVLLGGRRGNPNKRKEIRTLRETTLQGRLWKTLAFIQHSRLSLLRQEKWQSAVLVRGFALFFPLSLEGEKKERKAAKKSRALADLSG